ncbi:MAG: VWA domain-containing protein [Acidobacteria bacterium]|nr:VWA domain-containing protein [Acidobacteriota bacterium]
MPVRQGSPLDTLGVTLSLVEGSGHPDQRRGVRRAGAPVVLIAALVCTPPGVLCAQEISPGPARQEQAIVFRAGVEVVTLTAAVRDGRGRVVRDLKRSDFQVLDTGIAQDIRDFHSGDAPISLAVLLDISGSMAVGGNMDRARHAVAVAMGMLTGGDDEAALFTFDAKLQEVVSFTKNLDAVRRVSLEGRPWGMTSLYDAIAAAAKSVAERANRHRALLVITDGADSGSRLSAPEVSGIASSIDVPVYLLTVVTPLDHPGGEFAVTPTDKATSELGTLADLSRWTGGDMKVASVPAHTVEAIRDLFAELRYQYLITFEPGARPGWHPLEVRTRNNNLTVHTRSWYLSSPLRSD